jgi:hypothetical protein
MSCFTALNRSKYHSHLSLLVFLVFLIACATTVTTEVGALAPAFTAQDVSGRSITPADYKDKKHVVLVFYIGHT